MAKKKIAKNKAKIDALTVFVDELISEKGLGNVEPKVLKNLKEDLRVRLNDRLNATIIASLPPERLIEFEQLNDSEADNTKIQEFVRKHIPDLEVVLGTEVLRFRETYLGI